MLPSGKVATLQVYMPMSAKPTSSNMMVASCMEGERKDSRRSYSGEMEMPNMGLYTARVTHPVGSFLSHELCVRLRFVSTCTLQLRVTFFPNTAFILGGTTT